MYLFALIYPHFIFINSIICFCKLHFFCFSLPYSASLPLIIPKSGTRFKVIAKHLRNFVHAKCCKDVIQSSISNTYANALRNL